MKKRCTAILLLATLISLFSAVSFAAAQTETETARYYDQSGNLITTDGLYYNAQGCPCFNADCYYLDGDENPVYVGGCRAYCYDENGDLIPCRYCYDAEGNAIDPPVSYRGCGGGRGRGCRWR